MTAFPSLIWKKRECREQKGLSDSRNTEQICDLLKLDLAAVLWGRGSRVRYSSRCCLQSIAVVYQAFYWVLYMPYLWSSKQLCHLPLFTKEETGQGHSISHIVPIPRSWSPHAQKIMEEWTNEWMAELKSDLPLQLGALHSRIQPLRAWALTDLKWRAG